MARARACPRVVLPTPGTPSISRCPRAKMLTSARRTTSSLPRMMRRRAFSSSAALLDTAIAVSGDIRLILIYRTENGGVTVVTGLLLGRWLTRERVLQPSNVLFLDTCRKPPCVYFPTLPSGPKLETRSCVCGPSRQALDPLRGRRMRREQVGERARIHSQKWLDDEQMRR